MYKFTHGFELLLLTEKYNLPIWKLAILAEIERSGENEELILQKMKDNLFVMKNSIKKGLDEGIRSVSGLTGGDARKFYQKAAHFSLSGKNISKAIASALAVTEVNSSMGKIVAAPTAGSSGVIPGAVIPIGEAFGKNDDEMIRALFTASAIGVIIAENATLAGAEGGCQAEVGSASAMAAAALVELMGGTPQQALDAASMAIINLLGLVCDPVAGLVEIPCQKRNAIGAVNAIMSADLALANIKSFIPFDEVVDAMYKVGRAIPCALKETAEGGLAKTPTAIQFKNSFF